MEAGSKAVDIGGKVVPSAVEDSLTGGETLPEGRAAGTVSGTGDGRTDFGDGTDFCTGMTDLPAIYVVGLPTCSDIKDSGVRRKLKACD